MKRRHSLIWLLLTGLLCLPTVAQGPTDGTRPNQQGNPSGTSVRRASPSTVYRLIVHPKSTFDEVSKSRLSQILLKKSTKWSDGQRAFPVDLEGRSAVREALSKDIHGRSLASIKSFWQRQIFSGRSVPPPELANDQEVLDFVRRQPGAVGYISSQTPFDGVKELFLSED